MQINTKYSRYTPPCHGLPETRDRTTQAEDAPPDGAILNRTAGTGALLNRSSDNPPADRLNRGEGSYRTESKYKNSSHFSEQEANSSIRNVINNSRDLQELVNGLQTLAQQHRQEKRLIRCDASLAKLITEKFERMCVNSPKTQISGGRYWSINLSRMLYALFQFSGEKNVFDLLLVSIAKKISSIPENVPGLGAQEIGNALYGLQNLTMSTGVEAVLHALAPHISQASQLSAQAIGNALYGLQNLTGGAGVEAVLQALDRHIRPVAQSGMQIGEQFRPKIFLCEAIQSLSKLLERNSIAATTVIRRVAELSGYNPDPLNWRRPDEQKCFVLRLLQEENAATPGQIDLHGLTHNLASFFVQETLRQVAGSDNRTNPPAVVIIFGRASHSKHSRNRMEGIVREKLSFWRERLQDKWKPVWSPGRVSLRQLET